jgi:iron only hydrogenase large subunit-like protein
MNEKSFYHAHEIMEERCNGRLKCVRHCPTEAIRVRDNKITFHNDLCIDCGICTEMCPENVFVPMSDTLEDFQSFKFHIVIPSNILYIQFDPNVHPAVIHRALRKIGFDAVADVAGVCEEVGVALRYHLKTHPQIRPLISTFCPAIVRFIQVSYPNLLAHLEPLDVPREIVARQIKRYYAKELGLKLEEIGVIYITPCTAKIVSIKQPAEKEKSWIDGAIPIKDIYNMISPEVIKIQQEEDDIEDDYHYPKHYPKAWGVLGQFSQNVGMEKSLSVSGICHVKQVFDDIENAKLQHIDFVEAMSCLHGCNNGVFCVKDPYVSRHNSIMMQKKFGRSLACDKEKVLENYKAGRYFFENPVLPRITRTSETVDIGVSIKRMRKKERIFAKLPQKDCCLCGAPTCEAFAEDCARNEADITECVFFSK